MNFNQTPMWQQNNAFPNQEYHYNGKYRQQQNENGFSKPKVYGNSSQSYHKSNGNCPSRNFNQKPQSSSYNGFVPQYQSTNEYGQGKSN